MKAVGIKAFKAKLSEYVRLVKGGETILITERDDVVAELRPARRQDRPRDSLVEALDVMAEQGAVTLRSADGPWSGPQVVTKLAGQSSQQLLDALRGE